jgi:hypothetical protein
MGLFRVCFIDIDAVNRAFVIPHCVVEHSHRGTHDGEERGFICSECHDGIMGRYAPSEGVPVFNG